VAYTDLCAPCLAAREAEKHNRFLQEADVRTNETARIKECLLKLDRAGVRPQKRSSTTIEYKSFGRRVRKVIPLEPAWPIGALSWKFSETHMRGEEVAELASGVTRDLELVPMNGDINGGTLQAWSQHKGPYGNDAVRHQVLEAAERMVARLRIA
jgi:hypothetical protein